ncbi:MAG: hypothetical protein R3C69_11040 [Geminicoccaceae bacterium]
MKKKTKAPSLSPRPKRVSGRRAMVMMIGINVTIHPRSIGSLIDRKMK